MMKKKSIIQFKIHLYKLKFQYICHLKEIDKNEFFIFSNITPCKDFCTINYDFCKSLNSFKEAIRNLQD
jgi:uncharacterized membrane protein YukC